MEKNKKTIFSGFSLLESMVSVFIVTAGMLAAMTLASVSINDSLDSRNQIVASLLAEEGIELVRNVRDNNWMSSGNSFDRNLDSINPNCRIARDFNYTAGDSIVCALGGFNNNYRLYLDESTGAYSHDSTKTPTKYFRRILNQGDANSRLITSTVVWGGSSFPSVIDCNTKNKCAYSQVILNKWGSN